MKKFLNENIGVLWLLFKVATLLILIGILICIIFANPTSITTIDFHEVINTNSEPDYAFWQVLAGLGSAALSGMFQGSATEENNATQIRLAREQMNFNRGEAQRNRNFQAEQQQKQNEWNQQMWWDTFHAENAYNSPSAQMARLQQAGINPFVAAGDVANVGNSSLPAPTAGNAPSGSAASAPGIPHTDPVNYLGGFPAMALQIAQAYDAIASAKQKGVNTNMLEANFDTWLKTNEAELEKLNLGNHMQAMLNDYEAEFGRSTRAANLAMISGTVMLNLAKENETYNNIKLIGAKIDEAIENANLTKANKDWLFEQKPYLIKKIQEETRTIQKQGNMYDAQSASAYAVAQNQMEQAKTEAALRDTKKGLLEAQQGATKADMLNTVATMYNTLERLGMDKGKYVYDLENLKNLVKSGKIKNAQEFVNLLYLPIEKNVHIAKEGSEAFENLVPW